jgi:hypothetical protein
MNMNNYAPMSYIERLSASGWNDRDALEFRHGLAELGTRHGLPALISDLIEESQICWMSGEYREGRQVALEVCADERANLYDHQRASFLAALNMFYLGEWGGTLQGFAAEIAEAQRNDNDRHSLWPRVQQALLHLHALDFKGVRATCESALGLLRDPALSTAPRQPIGYAAQVCRALILSEDHRDAPWQATVPRPHRSLSGWCRDCQRRGGSRP